MFEESSTSRPELENDQDPFRSFGANNCCDAHVIERWSAVILWPREGTGYSLSVYEGHLILRAVDASIGELTSGYPD